MNGATKVHDGIKTVLDFFQELTGHSWMEQRLIDFEDEPLQNGFGTIGDAVKHMSGLMTTDNVFERGVLTDRGQEMFETFKGLADNPA